MKTHQAYILVAGLLTLFGGCAVGPDYHLPVTSAPANWSEPQLAGTAGSTVEVTEWWKTFHDPELDSLLERAVRTNNDLRLAEAHLRESRATRSGAAWDLGPTAGAAAGYTREQTSKNGLTFTIPNERLQNDVYDAHFDASWELDLFGAKRRSLESATARLQAGEEDRRDVLVTVLGDVARNYVEVRGVQQRLAIAQKNISAQAQSVELTRARFHAGRTSELDVRQAEALLASVQAQVPPMQTTLKQAIYRLGVLLGQQPGALLGEVADVEPIPTTPPSVPVGLPSELLRRRPDVRRAERQLAAATADIGVQMAELFPKLSLVGTAGLQSVSAGDWLTGGSRYWSLGPTVAWRLLDFGRIDSQIKAADARQEQALIAYEQTVLTSLEDVENALAAYANEQAHYKALNDSVVAYRRALEVANARYTAGVGDFLSVLDAQRSLYGAEDQSVDSQRAVTENLVTLYKALGGGWETTLPAEGPGMTP